MKVYFKKLNSCTMRKQNLRQYHKFLTANGHQVVNSPHESDLVLVWTCAFRKDVRDNSLSEIRRYRTEYNEKELVVAGCLPGIIPGLLKENFSGRVIEWNGDERKMEELFGCSKMRFKDASEVFVEERICKDAEAYRNANPEKYVTFHDQFLKLLVSEGCVFNCAYCSERLAFPPYRSFPENELVETARKMVEETGQLEVILMADCLCEYGLDIGSNLPSLIRKLLKIHPDLKVALNNFNPNGFLNYLTEMTGFIEDGKIRHLNMPIQTASERLLRLMDRPYSRADIDKVFGLLNKVGFSEFDTHIIIGFSGETEEDARETVEFLKHHKFKYALLSKYMEAPEMPSAKLPGKVSLEEARIRIKKVADQLEAAGIICNCDEGVLIQDRFKRLNLD